MISMLVGALLLLPRRMLLPPHRLVEVPPHRAAIRRLAAPRAQAGGGGGGKPSEAEQLLHALSQAQQDGGLLPLAVLNNIKRFSSDRAFVLAAVQRNDNALSYASDEMQADREVVLTAVQKNPRALAYVSAELRADREIVLAAVRGNSFVLQYAAAELRADREVVLAAVQQIGVTLQHASAELQADPEVVLVAMEQDQGAIRYASAELHASGHPFGRLDTLADCGRLKVLRSLTSVLDCGDQMENCFRDYDLTTCGCQVLVMLEDDSRTPLAVGAFKNGGWDLIQHNQVLRGGNRACGRGDASALPPAYDAIRQQFEPFLPALQAFEASYYATLRNAWHQPGGGDSREGACPTRSAGSFPSECPAEERGAIPSEGPSASESGLVPLRRVMVFSTTTHPRYSSSSPPSPPPPPAPRTPPARPPPLCPASSAQPPAREVASSHSHCCATPVRAQLPRVPDDGHVVVDPIHSIHASPCTMPVQIESSVLLVDYYNECYCILKKRTVLFTK